MKRLLVALIMLAAFFCLPVKAEAAGKTLRIPGPACQKGNDIYYCYTMGGLRMNLMKINKKTNKILLTKGDNASFKVNIIEANG